MTKPKEKLINGLRLRYRNSSEWFYAHQECMPQETLHIKSKLGGPPSVVSASSNPKCRYCGQDIETWED